ncbi:MAG: MFS transporter [Bacteroidetes bacterium]|nr:MFS transporter [Bacteroidota bacterium]
MEENNYSNEQTTKPHQQTKLSRGLSNLFGKKINFKQTFSALQFPNYKLWFIGQIISLFGTWMQTTAEGYLVFELTHSPLYLGYVGFAAGIPAWLFMFYGGVVADRNSRRTILILTQALMMLLAFILASLTFFKIVQAWHIILLAFFLGLANAFDAPARQAFLLELVDKEKIINAIALNSTMLNSARIFGPAAAGLIYAAFGPAWCFALNGLSFVGVIIALFKMDINPIIKIENGKSIVTELKEGIKYSITHPMIRNLIILVSAINLFGISFVTLIPDWAVKILHGDATTNGIMQSARGVGALLTALMIASLGGSKYIYRLLAIGIFSFPISLIIFAIFHQMAITFFALFWTGVGIILIFNLSNGIIQNLVSDDLRGRVMSVYSFTSFGFLPIGALIIGILAEHFGESNSVLICAFITIIFSFLTWNSMRKIKSLNVL